MANLVRAGHRRSLELLRKLALDPAVRRAVAIGVYPRPTNSGLRLVDVRADSPSPLGDLGLVSWRLAPEAAGEQIVLASRADRSPSLSKPKPEAAFESSLIRRALVSKLNLTDLEPEELALLYSQWRSAVGGSSKRTDLVALDRRTNQLVVVELKLVDSVSGRLQARRYSETIKDAEELISFFRDIGRVMAVLCGARELETFEVNGVGAPILAWFRNGAIGCTRVEESPFAGAVISNEALGPQIHTDDFFTARMRFHQSWYRLTKFAESECGEATTAGATGGSVGSMLRPDSWHKNFFSRPNTIALVETSTLVGDALDRCKRNMLSSQPMCFNLFGPLKTRRALATRIFREVLPEIHQVLGIEIEWPGGTTTFLGDKTALDAVIAYRTDAGKKGFLGIETKLCEPFSRQTYALDHRPQYQQVMDKNSDIWPAGKHERFLLTDERWNQLWRNHLLVEAVANDGEAFGYVGRLAVIRHPDHTDCAAAIRGYQALFAGTERPVIDIPLDRFLEIAIASADIKEDKDWLSEFNERYVDLLGSERAWLARQAES